jgi:WD40 repeat protein
MIGSSIDILLVSPFGYIVAHSWESLEIHLFWVNGQHLTSSILMSKVECMVACAGTTNIFVCGCSDGSVSFRQLWDLTEVSYLQDKHHGSVTCLSFSDDAQYLMIGCEDGTFSVAADSEAKWRALSAVIQKNPLL